MQETSAIEELASDASSRKRFLKAVGGTGAAGMLAALISACGSKKVQPTPGGSNPNTGAGTGTDQYGKGDIGILRFAMTLEYIENDFYTAALGSGNLSGRAATIARRFAAEEQKHLQALSSAITAAGSQPPAKAKPHFSTGSQQAILQQALAIEGLGAAALLGQVDRIQDKKTLALAISMHSVEGRHAATFASLLNQDPAPEGAFAQPAFASDVINQLHSLVAV
jgi:Ferritin-like domain